MNSLWKTIRNACLLGGIAALSALATEAPSQEEILSRADRLEQSNRFNEAVKLYEYELSTFNQHDPRWTAYVMFRLACAQYQAGDRTGAKESVNGAIELDSEEPSYKAFRANLMAELSGERRSTVYHAQRDSGSAKRLIATNGVLHLFVHGKNTDRWDNDEENKTRLYIDESDRWIQARAAESTLPSQPVFAHRYLTLQDEPFWRKTEVPDADSPLDYREAWAAAVLERFQASSYSELFDKAFEGTPVANRAVVFHTSKRDLAMTLSPSKRIPIDLESAVVASERSEWLNVFESVAYTHGLLRLYGADELSDKIPDPEVPESEIMNFAADCLDRCSLGALTRFAIGWTDQPPHLKILSIAGFTSNAKHKKGARG